MSLLSENVIPGDHGKVFGTNANSHADLLKIKEAIEQLEGIKDVLAEEGKFPREFTIHTTKLVTVKDITDQAKRVGFHVIPKGLFKL